MRTFIGVGQRTSGNGMLHTIHANRMPGIITERQRSEYQTDLRQRLADVRLIESIAVNYRGPIYVGIKLCNAAQRVAVLRRVLKALEAMTLHNAAEGLDSHVEGLT